MAVVSPCDRAARARGEAERAKKNAAIEERLPTAQALLFARVKISAHPAGCFAVKIHELPWHPEGARCLPVTSGVNFTQNQRFEFPYDVVSASSPEPVKDATVLGPIKAKPCG